MNTAPTRSTTLLTIALLTSAAPATAQDNQTAPPDQQTDDQQTTKEPADTDRPEQTGAALGGSLDELLGLEDEQSDTTTDPDNNNAAEPAREALDRALSGREAQDELLQALQQMDESAARLARLGDTGRVTQRLHEEILTKLEVLIRHAQEQDQQQGGQSSSSQSQQGQQGQQQSTRTPTDQATAQQTPAGQDNRQGQNSGQNTPPPARQTEQLTGMIDAASAAWGSLPERIRESLMQGLNDRFSALYEDETEAYYRRLAEDTNAADDNQ